MSSCREMDRIRLPTMSWLSMGLRSRTLMTIERRLETDQPRMVDVLANDLFPDGMVDSASVRLLSPPAHGRAEVNPETGSISYAPDAGFLGVARLQYCVADMYGNESPPATVTITVLDLANHPWQNPQEPFDTTADGIISPIDVLAVIDHLNRFGAGPLQTDLVQAIFPPFYLDVSGDDSVSPIDVLWVIEHLNQGTGGEGEANPARSVDGWQALSQNSMPNPQGTGVSQVPKLQERLALADPRNSDWRDTGNVLGIGCQAVIAHSDVDWRYPPRHDWLLEELEVSLVDLTSELNG